MTEKHKAQKAGQMLGKSIIETSRLFFKTHIYSYLISVNKTIQREISRLQKEKE